ncbi:MAG: tetratricopeptide repeat protein [Flavisolibacter sp.]
MKKSAIVLFLAAFLSVSALAQNVQEGVNNLYAQRYQSAQSTFEKILATNPNNIEASYWLGQTYIAQKNIAGAQALYQKAATSSNNAPLILVGLGQIALLQGRAAEAHQQFEAAINASRGKKGNDPSILNAVGRANVESYTEQNRLGDLDYAIARLNEAAQLAPNNPDIFLNLGNAYRKKGNGGQAVMNYMKAKSLNSTLAMAPYRTAMLYKTQVNYRQPDNWSVVLDNLNNAVSADPRFAPAYLELYYYYLLGKQDFATAQTYADKYVSASDPSPENDYLKAQTLWAQKKYPEAIASAKAIIAQTNNNPNPRVYRLLAYSYMSTQDTTTACDYTNQFFSKASEEDVISQDYILHAQACDRNNPDAILADITKAVNMDSVKSRQISLLEDMAKDARANNQRLLEAGLNEIKYKIRGADASPGSIINEIVLPYYFGGAFQKADSASKVYSALQPDSIYGYYWSALSLSAIDTTMQQGLAMESFQKSLDIAQKDKVRFKSQGVRAAQTLAVYYNNVKADKGKALTYVNQGLEFDPTNASLLQIQKLLQTPTRAAPPQTPTKTKTTPTKAKVKGKG